MSAADSGAGLCGLSGDRRMGAGRASFRGDYGTGYFAWLSQIGRLRRRGGLHGLVQHTPIHAGCGPGEAVQTTPGPHRSSARGSGSVRPGRESFRSVSNEQEDREAEDAPAEPLPGPATAEPEQEPTDPTTAGRRASLLANILSVFRRSI